MKTEGLIAREVCRRLGGEKEKKEASLEAKLNRSAWPGPLLFVLLRVKFCDSFLSFRQGLLTKE